MNEKNFIRFLLSGDVYSLFLPRVVNLIAYFFIISFFVSLGFFAGAVVILVGLIWFYYMTYTKWKGTNPLFNQPNSSTLFRDIKNTKLTQILFLIVGVLVLILLAAFAGMAYFACLENATDCKETLPWVYNIIY